MKQQMQCHTGKACYRSKKEAEEAHPDARVTKCNGCRWWHASSKKSRGRG